MLGKDSVAEPGGITMALSRPKPPAHRRVGYAMRVRSRLSACADRLTRNVDLLRSLVASGVDLVFCDLPSVPPGPMGRFLLTQMAAVAELEAGLSASAIRMPSLLRRRAG